MDIKKNTLFNKVYGCLLGGLIGDSMGAPTENLKYWEIEEKFREVNDFSGTVTDDSAIKDILCQAIIENDGYITADEFAEFFLKNREKYFDLFFIPVQNLVEKLRYKTTLPVYAGKGNMPSSSSAMAISPMGIINACNPRQASLETYDLAGLIHGEEATYCKDAACIIAAAVAESFKPKATAESVIKASTAFLHKQSSGFILNEIKEVLEIAYNAGGYKEFRKRFYNRGLSIRPSDSKETIPATLSLLYLSEGDPVKSIIYAVNFGRDTDTIGTMVGAITGALKGATALKPEWLEKFKDNKEQLQLAEKLMDIALKKAGKATENMITLKGMV